MLVEVLIKVSLPLLKKRLPNIFAFDCYLLIMTQDHSTAKAKWFTLPKTPSPLSNFIFRLFSGTLGFS